MATLTLEYVQLVHNYETSSLTVKSGETVSDRRGKYLRVDATTGKAMLGNATTATEVGTLRGVALSTQTHVGDSVTLLRHGLMDWGDALDDMDFGDPIYLSDTDGTFADAAGTVTTAICGYVWPVFEHDGTVKKLAYINTLDVLGA
jgi:hypothetical protein